MDTIPKPADLPDELSNGPRAARDLRLAQSTLLNQQIREVNEALILSSLHQHEMTETAEALNTQLRLEISERKQAEEALRANEERFRALFELGPVAVYSCDLSGVIREFNQRAAELWGRKPALNDTEERFCGSSELRNSAGHMPHNQSPMAQVLSGRLLTVRDTEAIIVRPDGSQITVVVNIRPLTDVHGEKTGAINCFYDITERKKAERELSEKARLLDLSNDAIILQDRYGNITLWNKGAERLYGWTFKEAVGKNPNILLEMEFPKPIYEILAQLKNAGHYEGELVQVARDGRRISALCRRVMDSETNSVLTSYTDITERRMLEDALVARAKDLARVDRSKDEFLAMLAHELRNPLVPIRSAAEVLKLAKIDDPVITKVQAILERQANHMTRLVDDLLDSSRIQHRKVTLHRISLDLASSVLSVLDTVSDAIKQNQHHLIVEVHNDPPLYINADPARVAQIVSNLVINAVKYTPKNGTIHFSITREKDMAVVRVKDNGVGIEAHMLQSIFGLFTQVEVSLERSQGGLGLGLKLVKELVEMQGGTVEAHSAGKGLGSEFIVRFPEATGPNSILVSERDNTAGPSRNILIIDDNTDILESMTLVLELYGHVVETAEDGIKGAEKALNGTFDLALIDIGLPGMNGYEVATKIRTQQRSTHMVLIALTGYGQENDKRRAIDAGFNMHLTKPVDPDALEGILRGLEINPE